VLSKQQHIEYWVKTSEEDWSAVETLFAAKKYLHCLFFAHLVLEKLCKAHWVKSREENIPPKIHNLIILVRQSNINLSEEMLMFMGEFNDFQLQGRYPDYMNKIYKVCTKEYTAELLENVKEIRQCLLKMLQ